MRACVHCFARCAHGRRLCSAKTNPLWWDIMKQALPSLVVWLLGFYTLFHCWLNVLGEVLRFDDRRFFAGTPCVCVCVCVCACV